VGVTPASYNHRVKRCKKCDVLKPLSDFYGEKTARDGHRPECKACSLAYRKRWYRDNRDRAIAYVREWQQAHPDRVKAWRVRNRDRRNEQMREIHLRNKFGLTFEEYDTILELQDGVCALCECPPTPGISLHVDHDHGTGEIRGLLCMRCNNALGLFREDPNLLKRAARYVVADARHRSQRSYWERVACERARALRGSAA
jgi:Recombination endonuclease VII